MHFVQSGHFNTQALNKQILRVNVMQSRGDVQKRNNMCSDILRHKQQKEHI